MDYGPGAPTIWMVTDGCSTGLSSLVSQGEDWKTAKITAFYSAKLYLAQQNYPVHEIEMLAGVETMLRHMDILQGAKFKWLTDHKGLIHLLNQINLSGRQARWLEKISTFNFEVVYISGSENVLVDALSRMYTNDSPGTERSRSESTQHDILDDNSDVVVEIENKGDVPVLAGLEAQLATWRSSWVRHPTEKLVAGWEVSAGMAGAAGNKEYSVAGTPKQRKEGKTTLAKVRQIAEASESPRVSAASDSDAAGTSDRDGKSDGGGTKERVDELPSSDSEGLLLAYESLGLDMTSELRGKYGEDSFFKAILEKPKEFRNFEIEGQWIYLKENNWRVLCIPKVLIQGQSAREIIISKAHSMLAHLGANKILDYLQDYVWWKDHTAC